MELFEQLLRPCHEPMTRKSANQSAVCNTKC